MADTRKEIVLWLNNNFKPNDLIWIGEGGLTLEGISTKFGKPQKFHNELGGEPREEDEDV
jgi:hypothetical protein